MRSKNFYLKTRVQILSVLFCVIFSFIQTQSVNATGNDMQQQVNRVTGTIVDEHGETIIGANIMTEDGKTGTVTDIDGNFTLNVPYGTKLLITYIGYESETIEAAPGNIRVVLRESSVMLEDVQIVAYGAQKKVTVTGAIAAVQGEDSKPYYRWVEPGVDPVKPEGLKDDTHMMEKGARQVAQFVAEGIMELNLPGLSGK
jgi:hypothetical protein